MAKPRRATNAHTSYRFCSAQQSTDQAIERQALLDQALAGSTEAHGALLVRCRPIMVRYFRSRLPHKLARKSGAEDLMQEAALRALDRFHQFRGATVAQYVSWLTAICRNVLRVLQRSFRPGSDRDLAREVLLDEPCLERCEQHSFGRLAAVDATYQRREDTDRLQAALAVLPGDEREIVALRHEGGLTFVQIASRRGRSVDAVKRCYYQVIADLRCRLATAGC